MGASVKIPQFLEKFLNVYSVITVGIGFILIILINSPYLDFISKRAEAFPNNLTAGCQTNGFPVPWGQGEWPAPTWKVGNYEVVGNSYIEIPEGSYTITTNARWHSLDDSTYSNVRAFAGLYTPPFGGPLVGQSGEQTFTVNPGAEGATNTWSFSYDFTGKCYDYQVDLSDPNAAWDSRCGAIFKIVGCEEPPEPEPECGDGVIDSGEECDPPGNTSQCQYGACRSDCTCPEPPVENACPYNSTEAKVRETGTSNWVSEITIYLGENFDVGSFHNSNLNSYATDIQIEVKSPSNTSTVLRCSTSEPGCNGHTITAIALGTYTVNVYTYKGTGGFYYESECRGTARVNVQQAPPGPSKNFTIVKEVDNGYVYQVGDTIIFSITIENIGDVVLDYMHFTDRYDPNYLEFSDISGSRIREGTVIQTVNLRDVIQPQNPSGEYEIYDLTVYLGNLGVEEKYVLMASFTAKAATSSNSTCNIAIAEEGDIRREDEVCVTIEEEPTAPPIPPTDK